MQKPQNTSWQGSWHAAIATLAWHQLRASVLGQAAVLWVCTAAPHPLNPTHNVLVLHVHTMLQVGLRSSQTRLVRIKNVLTEQQDTVEVPVEETLLQVMRVPAQLHAAAAAAAAGPCLLQAACPGSGGIGSTVAVSREGQACPLLYIQHPVS